MTDASQFLPGRRSLKALREAAAGCRGCELYDNATQTVFGEGRKSPTAATSRLAGRGSTPSWG